MLDARYGMLDTGYRMLDTKDRELNELVICEDPMPFHRRCFGISNVEQGMSIEEEGVRSFNNQHSLFDIHYSNQPRSPVKLHR